MIKTNMPEFVRKGTLDGALLVPQDGRPVFTDFEAARTAIDSIFNEHQKGRVRTACPVLIVAGGGTGAAICRRLKAYVKELGMDTYVRIVVLDTDAREQESEGNLPGFTDAEFCHMRMDRVRLVLEDPEKHPLLAERLDLGDPKIRAQLASIAEKDLRQAGQVRVLGLLAYYANRPSVLAKLQAAISDLNGRWAELKNQLASAEQVRLQDRFYVLMIGSAVGGTFSSIAVDVGVQVKRLVSRCNVEMVLILTTADVYERDMAGKPEEWDRIKTNCYATVHETDAFSNGWAQQQSVTIGRSEREVIKAPAGLFTQIYLVQRCDASGNDLETKEAVFDTVALHLTADICLTIGGKLASLQMNDVALQGVSVCPDTHLPRHFSTLSATALALPRARLVRHAINFAIDCEAKQQAVKLLVELRARVRDELASLTASISSVEAELERFEWRAADNRESRSVTADSQAEIDVTPPGFFAQFYHNNALTGQDLLSRVAAHRGEALSDVILAAGSDPTVIAAAATEAMVHFTHALSSLNVVDVLANVLEQGGASAAIAKAQIQQALSKCKPMWDADIGDLDGAFADTVVIGIPHYQAPNGARIVDGIRQQADALMNGDSLYQARANIVTTNDPHRVYIVRRSHGGRPHYLRDWYDWRASYRQWRDNGGHPVHIIPQKLVATLPPMEPRDEMSKADLAFAVALAYGFVAQRGPFYYRNLEQKNRSGVTTFVVPLNSHWNGIAFEGHAPRLVPGSALKTFVDSGRMQFLGRDDVDPRLRLAQGREEALEAFRKEDAFVDLVFEAFDSICESAGNTNVASQLEAYLHSLEGRYKVGDTHFDQVREEIELLAGLLTELHARS